MASILLLGLDQDLADSLAGVLRLQDHEVTSTASLTRVIRDKRAQLVFAAGDSADYRETVTKLVAKRPGLPIIVVNRFPENDRWLNALELGAADYCGAPFESIQVRWLIDGALRTHRAAA